MAATVAMTVVLTPGPPTSLDLHGRLTPAALTAALALLPPCTPTLHRHTAHHHTLTLPPPPFPAGRLSDLLTGVAAAGEEPCAAREPDGAEHAEHSGRAGRHGRSGRSARAGRSGYAERADPEAEGPLPITPLQRDVLLDAMTHPGAGLHVEQLHWRWYGPLDARRFTAAWQTLYDSEAVLRTALARPAAPGAGPLVAVHPHAAPQLERHARGSADWHALLLSERMREFDLYRPGTAMRIALLEEPGQVFRVLLTYHRALLDGWSARVLRRTLYRAYLADGRPVGSERRPDIRDHMRWLARQDPAPARAFWARAGAPADAAGLPGRAEPAGAEGPSGASEASGAGRPDGPHQHHGCDGHAPGSPSVSDSSGPRPRGHGRTRQRLTPDEALRLRNWAAGRGATESTALHAVWALQLHRAAPGAAAVAFAAAVSGRGIPLPGADRLPGPLRSALPLHVRIDPAAPLTGLLTALAGQALDTASYEWVSPGQAAQWSPRPPACGSGPGPGPGPGCAGERRIPDTLIAFEATAPAGPAGPADDPVHAELAAEGVRVGAAEAIGAHTALPFAVTAHHDAEGGLVLTSVYDRTRVADSEAAETLAQTTLLLRELPDATGETTTVAEALALLDGSPVPRVTRPAAAARALRILRAAARTGAGTICLVPPPDAPPGCYDELAEAYPGPQALTTVRPPADARTVLAALRPALARGEPLLLGGFSGAGSLASEVAERIASYGWHPPLVAIGGALTAEGCPDPVRALARTLETAAATATSRP
ncbi:condensation domain-containing protein [Streptomyces sp. NPDC059989]|uniref:condensation domain-containing protein n=1 Tax=Streptomyces sp. NPDC059989 TaxID=3347026 RepID=UPI0036CC9CE0